MSSYSNNGAVPPLIPPNENFSSIQATEIKVNGNVEITGGTIYATSMINTGGITTGSLKVTGYSALNNVGVTGVTTSGLVVNGTSTMSSLTTTNSTMGSLKVTGTSYVGGVISAANIITTANVTWQGSIQLVSSANYTYTSLDVARGCVFRTSGGGGTDTLPSVANLVSQFGLTSLVPPSVFLYLTIVNRSSSNIYLDPGTGFNNFLMTNYSINRNIPNGNSAKVLMQIDGATSGFWCIVSNSTLP